MEYQHGGDIYRHCVALDYSANINPLGPPEGVKNALWRAVDFCACYPDSRCESLKAALAGEHGVACETLICGNGAADLIFQIALTRKPRRALLAAPSFSEYEQALRAVECEIQWYALSAEDGFRFSPAKLLCALKERENASSLRDRLPDIAFFCNPNNPTGLAVRSKEWLPLLEYCGQKGIFCVMDECFNEFLEAPGRYSILDYLRNRKNPNVFLLKAFTKIYGIAGVRLGYGICYNGSFLEKMERFRQPWSVSAFALAAGEAALKEKDYVVETRKLIAEERAYLKERLSHADFHVFDSMANYVFFRDPREAARGVRDETPDLLLRRGRLYEKLLAEKILIRSCANYRGLDASYYRVCVKKREDNERLMEAILRTRDII